MKMKSYFSVAVLAAISLTSCQEDTKHFDNKIFAPSVEVVTTINVKPSTETARGFVEARIAKEDLSDVAVTFAADEEMVKVYNAVYGADCKMLPQGFYNIPEPTAIIPHGGNTTGQVPVDFINLSDLDLETTYVLPVKMDCNLGTLDNNCFYFVIQEASLISTVADMTKNYACFATGNQATELGDIKEITVEALLYPFDFPNMLATVMGIEGQFLVRIGDAGIPANQLQLATANGNVTDPAWQFDTNTWTFLTLTYNCETGETKVYFNGVQKGETQMGNYRGSVNWNTASGDITDGPRGFYVGYAYDANRYFNGYMSELRVWNRILTKEEINEPFHFYTVDNNTPGLAAYWKVDEGAGNTLHDYANGYDLKCESAPEWIPVSLPEQ